MPIKARYRTSRPTSIYLLPGQIKALKWIKKKHGLPGSEFVRRAVTNALERWGVPQGMLEQIQREL